ncbi:hypothetical protein N7481_002638 [Penicillium waksmanii]|uniref:uncharacterized protein n=1 Tax=Penicillium waksmanii TaxID=69791 RepID=UPI0025470618|nr:uncharacterized protein N7481_002638 [Penicillium waksmanii]KAJ5995661.1 hypothetical protein N7481_002638 [Penicillium waksmanii]
MLQYIAPGNIDATEKTEDNWFNLSFALALCDHWAGLQDLREHKDADVFDDPISVLSNSAVDTDDDLSVAGFEGVEFPDDLPIVNSSSFEFEETLVEVDIYQTHFGDL